MRLLSLLGLDARLRRLRIALGEGALAAEDRVQLLKLAWEDERQRLRLLLALVVAVIGLTTVTVALLSVAVVVHFWDTPHRVAAAWSVAVVWIVLWVVAVVALMNTLRRASGAFEPARREFERDWEWLQARFDLGDEEESSREPRPRTREELLARIARQRERIATLQAASPKVAEQAAADETASAAALRIAREHPIATGAVAAAAAAVIGPRRLLRWAAVIVPVLWRMR
ncbi:phage holin family protein [Variovorax soli]|uniref:Membrane protein YqjE n=1 Tax=Variovorax soli TaxID=376815 RepID=A0ABU1NBA4_9BURK|nr:phage holin family protein [Variovorax soli]MDR6535156.1 putative membrane protein YqjE [Variovorax soli]